MVFSWKYSFFSNPWIFISTECAPKIPRGIGSKVKKKTKKTKKTKKKIEKEKKDKQKDHLA